MKSRAYGSLGETAQQSALVSLRLALSTFQRLFAPFLPFATEEVWSWWRDGSVHTSSWPDEAALRCGGDPAVYRVASEVLGAARRAKTEARKSLRAAIESVVVTGPAADLDRLGAARSDVLESGNIAVLDTAEGGELSAVVTLAPDPA